MCYPKPGPRCSNHLAKDINKATVRLAWLDNHADPNNAAHMTEKHTLTSRREELLREYDGTLAGQKKLETAIAAMSDGDPDYESVVAYKKAMKTSHTKKANAYKKALASDPSLPEYEASVVPVASASHGSNPAIDFPHNAYDVSLPDNMVARYEVSYDPTQHSNPLPRENKFNVRMSYVKYSDTGAIVSTDEKHLTVDKNKQDAENFSQLLALDMKRNYKKYLTEDGRLRFQGVQ